MKRLFYILVLCLYWAIPLQSQQSSDYQFQFLLGNTLRKWVPGPDGAWFGGGWSTSFPGYPMGVPFVIKWDPAKDILLWKRAVPMPYSEYVWDVDLLPLADGGVYIGAAFDGCDYPTPDGLARLNASGTIQWTVLTPDDYRTSYKFWLIPYPNGHLLFKTDYYQIEYDADGQLKWANKTAFPWNGIAPRQSGGYLTYGDHKIGTSNLLLSILELPFPENTVHARQLPSGGWLVLGDKHLFRLAPDFAILNQAVVPGINYMSQIFETGGTYWISGEDAAGASALKRIDTLSLAVLSTHAFDENYRVNAIVHEPGDSLIWLSGDCNADLNQRGFLIATSKDDPDIVVPDRSVALTDIRLEQVPATSYNACFGWDPNANYAIDFGRVYVTVKNTGTVPVQKFSVNGLFGRCSFICTSYEEVLENRNALLMPGESQEILLLQDFDLDGQYNSSTITLCFWAAVPDERLDGKPEDDMFCKEFAVMVPAREPNLSADVIQVFPNPAVSEVTFSIDAPGAAGRQFSLSLTDAMGRVFLQEIFTGSVFDLPRGTLPAGVYFYEITSSTQPGRVRGTIVFIE